MLGCHERGGWLGLRGELDEDAREDALAKLTVHTDNPAFNAIWHLLLELDPNELLAARRKQKVQLARYARLGRPGEGLGWDDVEATELQRIYGALREVLEAEAPSLGSED